ncbi:acyltransferase family protein [Nonomuraea sp. NPDC059023]|uniref:acyltransferase family protein n=1 Tax=unclassified Nonomuraea TaxID=2593643 RepID=UPI003689B3FF
MKTETRTRLLAVDNLRVVLTALVVVHHVAVTYGNIPAWYVFDKARDGTGLALDVLVMFNQAFFMGFFFLISGFFTPRSYDRKGPGPFMRDRLKRLGIPLLAYLLFLRPVALAGVYDGSMPYWHFYIGSWDPGPMWFVEVLLVLTGLYVLWRRSGRQLADRRGELTFRAIALFVTGLTLAVFAWRFLVPVGQYWPVAGLPTPSYLPQYASMFVLGLIAQRRGWFETLPRSAAKYGFIAAGIASAVLLPAGMWTTGWAAQLGTAAWESVFAVSMVIALSVWFRERFDRQGPFGRFLADQAFTVYIIHPLVLVGISTLLSGLAAPAIAKFALVAALALPICWGLGYLVRSIPGARRIL